jgi:hypothetical protein
LTRRIGVFGYNFFTQQGEKWLKIYKCNRSRCVHEQMIPSGCDTDVFLRGSSLIDIYAKCGRDAWRVFNKMPSQDSWSLESP